MLKNKHTRSKTSKRLMALLMTLVVIFGGAMTVVVRSAGPARADDGGYPWIGATTLNQPTYDWGYSTCPNNDTRCKAVPSLLYTLNGTTYGEADPWGYGLRNCTSYVAWKIAQEFSGRSVAGLGDAKNWWANATGSGAGSPYASDDGNPQVGDIAVWTSGTYGHVAYVAAVASGVATFDEYNAAGTGLFTGSYTSANHPLVGGAGSHAPDHYIHMGTPADGGSGGSPPPPPPPLLTTLVTPDGTQHVYSGTATGSLYETWWGPSSPSPTTWRIANVGSAITGISAQVTADGNEHVYYGTVGGTVGEVWWGPNSGGVHNGQSYNIGAAVTALSSQVTADGVQHIYSADAAGSVFETWWGSGLATTSQIYNTGANIVSISSQVTADGTEHIFFGATNGEVGEVWWNATSGGGHLGSTANVGTNVTAVSSQITPDNVRHIYSANSVGGLDETWWGPNSSGPTTWQVANVGHHPTAISSQITSDGIEHIYYGTSFGQFGEVWWNANGVHLGQTYSDPAGVSDGSIASQLTAGGTQQNVYAVNTAGTLFAMWWSSGNATTSAIGQVS